MEKMPFNEVLNLLVADISSNFLSKPVDVSRFGDDGTGPLPHLKE